MRASPLIAAAAAAIALGMPATAQADTGTADLAVTRLTIAVHGNTATIRAEATNLGPDVAEPSIGIHTWGGTVVRSVCYVNKIRIPDSADSDACEIAPDMGPGDGKIGMIVKLRVPNGPGMVSAQAYVYDLGDTTDPVTSNDTRIRSRTIR